VRCLIFGILLAAAAAGHDIPLDVTARILVKPSGNRLELLVRVPLKAIRDVEFPARADGYLDTETLDPWLGAAAMLWIGQPVEVYQDGVRLPRPAVIATRLSFESDRSFASFEEARAHVTGPKLPAGAKAVWNQLLFDVLLQYPIRSDRARFSIRPGLDRLASRVVTVLQFIPPAGSVQAYEFTGDPGRFPLDPRWSETAARFVQQGFIRMINGTDYLLFLLCLVIPFRRIQHAILPVAGFAVAHSFTLIASACKFAPDALWFPPLIETLIAASIVYVALENIAIKAVIKRRWMFAAGFGLIYGFGLSLALRDTLQFAGSHVLAAVAAYNLGLEAGLALIFTLLIGVLHGLFRYVVTERIGIIIISALAAHAGWHEMTERWASLRQFQFQWPTLNAALLAAAMQWLLVAMILAAALCVVLRLWAGGLKRRRVGESACPTFPEAPQDSLRKT
jgi:hypothetical protein